MCKPFSDLVTIAIVIISEQEDSNLLVKVHYSIWMRESLIPLKTGY